MLVARDYLRLARRAAGQHAHLGSTKAGSASGPAVSTVTRRDIMLGAHLASAAIRLASIDAVLSAANAGRLEYRDCRAFFRGSPQFVDSDSRASRPSEWFHVMLRDNATHEEPGPPSLNPKRRRWEIRQRLVERITFARAHAQLSLIADDLRTHLRKIHNLPLPT